MSLSTFLKQTYSVPISIQLLTNHRTTVTKISKHIYETRASKERSSSQNISFEIDLISEFESLNSQLETDQEEYLGTVFLTGATGFLGSEILRRLVLHDGVKRVVVLVRAQDTFHGKEKIVTAAKTARWWIESYSNSKLHMWLGDLALPRLGLSSEHWEQLIDGGVDTIIHNGATVHWNSDFQTLKAPNVSSTVEIFKILSIRTKCSSFPPMRFVYVSGRRAFSADEDENSIARKLAGLEGYSQTKFLSEMLIRAFARRCVQQVSIKPNVSIVKPGLIIGTEEEGVANKGDFLWRYVAAAVAIGAFPESSEDGWLVVSCKDRVADVVISALSGGANFERNVDVEYVILMRYFWDVVNTELERAGGRRLQEVGRREWFERVLKDIGRKAEGHPLWPVQYLLEAEGRPEGADGEKLKVAFARNVRVWRESGYFGKIGRDEGLN